MSFCFVEIYFGQTVVAYLPDLIAVKAAYSVIRSVAGAKESVQWP